ncbi:sirohydrochlorin chelatase [Timonella sp. A28]|uniref:sirohydrochlorin chelatase n=1 Tax=Timonella sp. A28 TaxID=3442640 RepID=UPI003EB9C7CF
MSHPTLLVCAHGTDNPKGRALVFSLVEQVRQKLPEVRVISTYVDVQHPQVDEVLGSLSEHTEAVVVPLLLSNGYHVRHDITAAVQQRRVTGGLTWAAPPLGPHPLLTDVLVERIHSSLGGRTPDEVVLVAAGSSDTSAMKDVEAQAELLTQGLGVPVRPAYLSAAAPTVEQALMQSADGSLTVVSPYLIAPGFFMKKLQAIVTLRSQEQNSEFVVAAPLGDEARLAEIVIDRYHTTRP